MFWTYGKNDWESSHGTNLGKMTESKKKGKGKL